MNSTLIHTKEKENKIDSKKIFIIKKFKKFNFWSPEEDNLLLDITGKLSIKKWIQISKKFKNKSPVQCSARYLKIKPGIKKGHWTVDEDKKIEELVNKYGTKWSHISRMIKNRTGKQIRDRYMNYILSTINRKRFTKDEDIKLKGLYIKYGTKWTEISKQFEGRSPEMIKNRFYSFLKPKIHSYETLSAVNSRSVGFKRNLKLIHLHSQNKNNIQNFNNLEIIHDSNLTFSNLIEKTKVFEVSFVNSFSILGIEKTLMNQIKQNSIYYIIPSNENIQELEILLENPVNFSNFCNLYLDYSNSCISKIYRQLNN
jgi:hypothetical protein